MLTYSTNTRKCPIRCWIFFHPTFIPRYRVIHRQTLVTHLYPVSHFCFLSARWMTIQRKVSGGGKCGLFHRGWESYKKGFGKPSGDYWYGLENLHQITSRRRYQLLIKSRLMKGGTVIMIWNDRVQAVHW